MSHLSAFLLASAATILRASTISMNKICPICEKFFGAGDRLIVVELDRKDTAVHDECRRLIFHLRRLAFKPSKTNRDWWLQQHAL